MHRKPPRQMNLVEHYSEIGIAAVAAAARYGEKRKAKEAPSTRC